MPERTSLGQEMTRCPSWLFMAWQDVAVTDSELRSSTLYLVVPAAVLWTDQLHPGLPQSGLGWTVALCCAPPHHHRLLDQVFSIYLYVEF